MSEPRSTEARGTEVRKREAQGVRWVPAVGASFASVPLLGLSLLSWGMALALAPDVLPHLTPPGVNVIQPSGFDIAVGITRHVVPIILGAGLLALTWRFAIRGKVKSTWLCAVTSVAISIAAVLW